MQIRTQLNNFNQISGNIGIMYTNSSVRMGDIKDGTTQSIMIAEAERFEALKQPNLRTVDQIADDGWAWGGAVWSAWVAGTRGRNQKTENRK